MSEKRKKKLKRIDWRECVENRTEKDETLCSFLYACCHMLLVFGRQTIMAIQKIWFRFNISIVAHFFINISLNYIFFFSSIVNVHTFDFMWRVWCRCLRQRWRRWRWRCRWRCAFISVSVCVYKFGLPLNTMNTTQTMVIRLSLSLSRTHGPLEIPKTTILYHR